MIKVNKKKKVDLKNDLKIEKNDFLDDRRYNKKKNW